MKYFEAKYNWEFKPFKDDNKRNENALEMEPCEYNIKNIIKVIIDEKKGFHDMPSTR